MWDDADAARASAVPPKPPRGAARAWGDAAGSARFRFPSGGPLLATFANGSAAAPNGSCGLDKFRGQRPLPLLATF
eukprot:673694-Prorocentrum_minimum.AAC.1